MDAIVVNGAVWMVIGVYIEAGLSIVGLGVQPPTPSIGVLLNNGLRFVTQAPTYIIGPGAGAPAALGGLQPDIGRAQRGGEPSVISTTDSTMAEPPAPVAGKDTPLLRVEGLRTEFKLKSGGVKAVNDVSFDIYPGDVLGIVGESGSGKSVTARSIMRMLRPPGEITAGSVRFDGEDLLALPEREMRRRRGAKVAMVFQDPQAALNPVLKVGDQIVEAMTVHGVDKKTARARAVELLEQVGIPDVDRRRSTTTRISSPAGCASASSSRSPWRTIPALLIADEPTTALDVTIQAQILRLLARLRTELGIAIAIITHDMGVVAELCTDVVVMYGGRTVEKGTVEQVFTHPRHPYTAALLEAMPRLDDDRVGQPLPAIPGSPPDPAALPPGCAFAPRCRYAEDVCTQEPPTLLEIGDAGQTAACFVAQRGVGLSASDVDTTPHAEAVPRVAPPTAAPVLEIRDLRVDVGSRGRGLFRREPPVYAVDSVSLAVHPGRTLGLVGESGCGKSTLSRGIVGINPIARRVGPRRRDRRQRDARGRPQTGPVVRAVRVPGSVRVAEPTAYDPAVPRRGAGVPRHRRTRRSKRRRTR